MQSKINNSDGKESAHNAGDEGQEDPLEKRMVTHSSILAWRIPWTEEPGRLLESVHGVIKSWTGLSDLTVFHFPKNPKKVRLPAVHKLHWVPAIMAQGTKVTDSEWQNLISRLQTQRSPCLTVGDSINKHGLRAHDLAMSQIFLSGAWNEFPPGRMLCIRFKGVAVSGRARETPGKVKV